MIARGSINIGGQPDGGGQGRVFDRHVTNTWARAQSLAVIDPY